MRSIILISIILVSFTIPSYGQNYINYYTIINKAEVKIVTSEYEKSLDLYQKAFKLVKHPFSKDLYNASLCAAKTGKDSTTYTLIKKLVTKGVPLKFFRNKTYKPFRKTKYWKELKHTEKELLKLAENNLNKSLLNQLKKIEVLDQKIRKKKFGYPMSDTIRKVDSINMVDLIGLIDRFGYPSENKIGVKNPKKTFQQPHNIVLRHFFQGQSSTVSQKNILGERLMNALKKGALCPKQYSVWEDIRYFTIHKKYKYGIYGVVLENKKYRRNGLKNIAEINEHRQKIGIGTYDDHVSKIIFQENQDEFYFGINEGIVKVFAP